MKTPSGVITIKDLIYYRYAKLISASAGFGRDNFAFIQKKFQQLKSGQIEWSSAIREFIRQVEDGMKCEYCGTKEHISMDHIIPKNRLTLETADNIVWACTSCNSSKGDKGLYEWYGYDRRNEIPRVVEGKYLKLLYKLHEENRSLDMNIEKIKGNLCYKCKNKYLCDEYIKEGKAPESILSVYCLENIFTK